MCHAAETNHLIYQTNYGNLKLTVFFVLVTN